MREIAKHAEARQEEISAASDGDELFKVANALSQAVPFGNVEISGDRAAPNGLAISQERVAFAAHGGKLGVCDPGVLQELELAEDVPVQANEMQP